MRLYLRPTCAIYNTTDSCFCDTVSFGKCDVCYGGSGFDVPYTTHLSSGQLRLAVAFASMVAFTTRQIARTVGNSVTFVVGGCAPRKIGDVIVAGVAVHVSALHTGRAWSHKRFEDEPVKPYGSLLASTSQGDQAISPAVNPVSDIVGARFSSTFAIAENGTIATDEVVWIPFDLTVFNAFDKLAFSHDTISISGLVRKPVGLHTRLASVIMTSAAFYVNPG